MELVDILARELKVWPEKSVAAVQQNSKDDRVSFVDCMDVEFSMGQWDYSEPCMRIHEQKESHEFERADDWKTAIVTSAEWQAAVDALKVAEGIADAEAGNLIPLDDVKSKYVEYSPAMHAQRVGRVTRVASQPALGDSREQFEQAYSEDNGVPVSFLVLDRLKDSYWTSKVARAWYWWKRARAGVVVVLPVDISAGSNIVSGDYHEDYSRRVRNAIEAAGVKVAES